MNRVETGAARRRARRTCRRRASGRSASPSASPCVLVGLVVSSVVVAVGAVIARRLRLPLDPRRRRAAYATPSRRGRAAAAAAPPPASRSRAPRPARRGSTLPAQHVPRGARRSASARVIGGARHAAGARLRRPAAVHRTRATTDVDLGPLDDFPEGKFVIATFLHATRRSGEVSRRTAYIRNNGLLDGRAELHDPLEPLRPPRLPGAAERARVDEDEQRRTVDGPTKVTLTPAPPPAASAARATAASTTPRATAPPARRSARSTATSSRSSTAASSSARRTQRRQGRGHGRGRARSTSTGSRSPGSHVDGPEAWLYPLAAAPLMATTTPEAAATASSMHVVALPARLARGALGPRRRRQVLPLPQGPARHELVPHARLGDADRVPRPGDHRRDPRDVLQAGSRTRPTSRSSTSRTTSRSAGSCAACTAGARASSSS